MKQGGSILNIKGKNLTARCRKKGHLTQILLLTNEEINVKVENFPKGHTLRRAKQDIKG